MMEKRKIRKFHLWGLLFTVIAGTLLHFVYDWSGGNTVAALFGAFNESTWEHLKLLFWPFIFFSILECFAYGKNMPGFLPAKIISICLGMLTIPVLFYTYTCILGNHISIIDIAIFLIGAMVTWLCSYRLLTSERFQNNAGSARMVALMILAVLMICFAYFTFQPPECELFRDPITGGYGLNITP